jgi:hypothetical protein
MDNEKPIVHCGVEKDTKYCETWNLKLLGIKTIS